MTDAKKKEAKKSEKSSSSTTSSTAEENSNSGKCDRCNVRLNDEEDYIEVMEMVFHLNCLICETCGVNLMKGFHYNFGRFYCDKCVLAWVPKCASCKNIIGLDRSIRAIDMDWHLGCCVCDACKQPFQDGRYFPYDGRAYCLQDYWNHRVEKEQMKNEEKTIKGAQNIVVKSKKPKKGKQEAKKGTKGLSINMEEY